MPYIFQPNYNQNLDEQNNLLNDSGTVIGNAQNPNQKLKQSGSYTNLQKYLNANIGQGEQLANQVGNKALDADSSARANIQNATTEFNTNAQKGTISNLDNAQADANSIINTAKSAAYQQQVNDEQAKRFKEISNAIYTGNTDLTQSDYYNKANEDLGKVKNFQENVKSEDGRFNLLRDTFNRPNYSRGQQVFDNLLMQGDSQAKQSLQNTSNKVSDLESYINKQNEYAASQAKALSDKSNAAKAYAQSQLLNQRQDRASSVDSYLNEQKNNWSNEYNKYNELLSNYKGGALNLSDEEMQKLGVSERDKLYNILNGINPSSYLDLKSFDANKVVSKDQVAQLKALDMLANQFGQIGSSKYNNIEDAGTLSTQNNFDASKFGAAQRAANNAFNEYAKRTNLSGHGQDEESYHENYFTDGSVTRQANLNANLADVLSRAGAITNDTTGGTYQYNPLSALPSALLDSVKGLVGADLSNAINSIVGGEDSSGAARQAQINANNQAQAQLYAELNRVLNEQGYANHIAKKR